MCYCVCVDRKRATAEEGLSHPWLNSPLHQHPSLHLDIMKACSLDEPETSQSESDPESPACSPELDLIGPYLLYPGQGELKTVRPAFSCSEPPFATRPEIQQELICWGSFCWPEEAALTPRSRRLIGLDPTRGLAFGLLFWLPGLLSFLWGGLCVFDTSVCFYVSLFADLWLLGRNEKQEKWAGKRQKRMEMD